MASPPGVRLRPQFKAGAVPCYVRGILWHTTAARQGLIRKFMHDAALRRSCCGAATACMNPTGLGRVGADLLRVWFQCRRLFHVTQVVPGKHVPVLCIGDGRGPRWRSSKSSPIRLDDLPRGVRFRPDLGSVAGNAIAILLLRCGRKNNVRDATGYRRPAAFFVIVAGPQQHDCSAAAMRSPASPAAIR